MRQRILAGIILSLTAATTNAALVGRTPLTPAGTDYQAYYDTVLNITWLADANAIAGTPFDDGTPSDGRATWNSTQAWLASLNASNFLGASDWRLPNADVNGNASVVDCNAVSELLCRDNEMGYQEEYNGVTQIACPGPAQDPCIGGPFTDVRPDFYWSGTTYAPNPSRTWVFYFLIGGEQSTQNRTTDVDYVWPVRSGDIGIVPIPAAVWLLGSALGVLGWLRRRATRS